MDTRRVLLGLAAHGLPSEGRALPDRPPEPDEWRRWRGSVRHERLTGQATAAADDGALVLTEQQRSELEEDHVAAMAHVVRLEGALLRVHDVLGDAGVRFAVLKGTAVAHLDYPDPARRAFGDVDVLLPSDRFAEGIAALLADGYVRPAAEIGPGFDVRFGKGATLVGVDGAELDVHRTFAMGPFGLLVRLDELWEDPAPFQLAGRSFLALGAEQRYLHACYHAVIGNATRRVLPYRDVAEMLLYGAHDERRLRDLAARWRAEVVAARAILETWEALGLTETTPLVEWARAWRPAPRDERLMQVYAPGTSYAVKALAGVTALDGWRDRLDYLRLLTLPGGEHAGATGRSRLGRLARAGRRVVRDVRRARTGRPEQHPE